MKNACKQTQVDPPRAAHVNLRVEGWEWKSGLEGSIAMGQILGTAQLGAGILLEFRIYMTFTDCQPPGSGRNGYNSIP